MKRKTKIIIIITTIIFIWGAMFTTDLVRAHKNYPPFFCISFADYDVSSGYIEYTGLFYKIERSVIEVNGNIQREFKVFPWFH